MVPWWNEGCNTAAGAWNRACRKLGKHPTKSYAIGYKRLRTKAGRVIKEAGDTSVENYEQIVLLKKKIWTLVHRVSGALQQMTIPIPVLHCNCF